MVREMNADYQRCVSTCRQLSEHGCGQHQTSTQSTASLATDRLLYSCAIEMVGCLLACCCALLQLAGCAIEMVGCLLACCCALLQLAGCAIEMVGCLLACCCALLQLAACCAIEMVGCLLCLCHCTMRPAYSPAPDPGSWHYLSSAATLS